MYPRMARTGMFKAILISALFFSTAVAADFPTISGDAVESFDRWTASGGSTSIRFDADLLEELDISVTAPARPAGSNMPGEFEFSVRGGSRLQVWAPRGAFDGLAAGELEHSGTLKLEWPGGRLETQGFILRPDSPESLELVDDAGNRLFRLDYIHAMLYREEDRVTLWNMDLRLSPWLADRMGYPDLANFVIGGAFSRAALDVPLDAPEGNLNCGPANWDDGGDFYTDVELSDLADIQEVAREANVRVAIAPAAMLRNVGTADVPWYEKFDTLVGGDYPPPYDRDQHPFLVWAMYRIVDGIPQQIGQSAVKHAFFSTNTSCDCQGGHILWSAVSSPDGIGCADTYSVNNNDTPQHLGIREEVPAFSGEWEQCGSMFAPDAEPPGPCMQTESGSDSADPGFERRLVVEEEELETPNATYFFEGWYVIRDDINIFNTMAHRQVTPTFGSTWTFPIETPHTQGPAINSWVPPNTRATNQAHAVENTANGHYSVAVKVSEADGGNHRYVYAVMNYDFDPKFDSFSLALPEGVSLSNIDFLDGDSNGANDWNASTAGGRLTWTAPAGAELEWGFMATFVFEADVAPTESEIEVTGSEAPLTLHTTVLGLVPGPSVYRDGFEN